MPKATYSQFDGGLSDSDRNAGQNQYYAGDGLDPYRDWGYLKPGFARSNISLNGLNTGITDILSDSVNSRRYILSDVRWFGVDSNDVQITNFDPDEGTDYVTVASSSEARGIIHAIRDTSSNTDYVRYALIVYNKSGDNNIAKAKMTSQWRTLAGSENIIKTWLTNPNGGYRSGMNAPAMNDGRRDIIAWNKYVWYTNGRYIGRIDVNVFPTVATPTFFDLGSAWTADRLFVQGDYLGIVSSKAQSLSGPSASRDMNESQVTLIDGSSNTLAVKIIPLNGVTQVHAVKNINGSVILWCDYGSGSVVGQLTDNGLDDIFPIQHDIGGTINKFLPPLSNGAVGVYRNDLIFGTGGSGSNGGAGWVFSVGKNSARDNLKMTVPFAISSTASSQVSAVRQVVTDKIYVGHFNGTTNLLDKLESGNQTPTLKLPYTDAGQQVRINYVKVYTKPLASGDSLTVGLDLDYGKESVTLGIGSGNFSNAIDGSGTHKRFDTKKVCHAFRPTVKWVSGGASLAKIVIDYDFIQDL